jgi:hypothetical protein
LQRLIRTLKEEEAMMPITMRKKNIEKKKAIYYRADPFQYIVLSD